MQIHAPDWSKLSDREQVLLSRDGLRQAAEAVAGQADVLADAIAADPLPASSGPDMLRLLARLRECALWARRVARMQD